jgi:hypothetical protein
MSYVVRDARGTILTETSCQFAAHDAARRLGGYVQIVFVTAR